MKENELSYEFSHALQSQINSKLSQKSQIPFPKLKTIEEVLQVRPFSPAEQLQLLCHPGGIWGVWKWLKIWL
jgi:hypothetical protein